MSVFLVAGCDGYAAGTTGTVIGTHEGCAVFVPDRPERVARWAVPRTRLIVPRSFVGGEAVAATGHGSASIQS